MPRRIGLTCAEWPPADRAAWERAVQPKGRFDEDAVADAWRPKTRMQAHYAYARWLAYVRDQYPDLLTAAPAARMTREHVRGYVEALGTRISPMGIAAELQHLLLATRALVPGVDLPWLRQWQAAYQKRARPVDKRQRVIDPRRLVELGMDLMDTAERDPRSNGRARRYRDGLLIALLAMRPLRRRSLAALELGRTLHVVAGHYLIELAADDTKSGHPVEFDVPEALCGYITRYLERYRPLFPKATETSALWLSSKGGALSADAIYNLVCQRTAAEFGFPIHPHLFRDCAVTAIAREAPQELAIARDLLTHAKLETTQHYDSRARTAEAARNHAATIARLRAQRPPRA